MLKRISVAAPIVGIVATSAVMVGAAVQPASAAGSCPNNSWSNVVLLVKANNFSSNGVNIRTGDSIDCTSKGHGQRTHDTLIHCNSWNGSWNWNHLTNNNTGVKGWVRVDNLNTWIANPC